MVTAHPALSESRPLRKEDLASFEVTEIVEHNGLIGAAMTDPENHAFISNNSQFDHRLERIAYQQFIGVTVIRRDVTFEMCGTSGTLVLSGNTLAGATTPDALKPIRRRVLSWVLASVAFCLLLSILREVAVGGSSAYFATARLATAALVVAASGMAVVALGGFLRAWRGSFRMNRLRGGEKVMSIAAAVLAVTIPALGLYAQPSLQAGQTALAAANLSLSRRILAALKETRGDDRDVLDFEDKVMLEEARSGSVAARLRLLDGVAARNGASAAHAASTGREVREQEVRRLTEAGRPDEALNAIERWFGATASRDQGLAELMARAHETAARQCLDDACRFASASAAELASTTPARARAVSETRARLTGLLSAEVPQQPVAERVDKLRAVGALADRTMAVAKDDAPLRTAAADARANVDEAIGRIALVGAEKPVVARLLEGIADQGDRVSHVTIDGTEVFAAFDGSGYCRGIYAVGKSSGDTTGDRSIAPAVGAKVLSQAVGRTTVVRSPGSNGVANVSWSEGPVRVMARWYGGALRELRIGDAMP